MSDDVVRIDVTELLPPPRRDGMTASAVENGKMVSFVVRDGRWWRESENEKLNRAHDEDTKLSRGIAAARESWRAKGDFDEVLRKVKAVHDAWSATKFKPAIAECPCGACKLGLQIREVPRPVVQDADGWIDGRTWPTPDPTDSYAAAHTAAHRRAQVYDKLVSIRAVVHGLRSNVDEATKNLMLDRLGERLAEAIRLIDE